MAETVQHSKGSGNLPPSFAATKSAADEEKDAGWDLRTAQLLQRLVELLRRVVPDERRHLFEKVFSNSQRSALERWMLHHRSDQSGSQHADTDQVDCLQVYTDDSSDEHSTCSEASSSDSHSDGTDEDVSSHLAICDLEKIDEEELDGDHFLSSDPTSFGSPDIDEHQAAEMRPYGHSMSGITIHKYQQNRQVRYSAYLAVNFVRLRSLTYLDLARALDAHLAFAAVREKVRSASQHFEETMKEALNTILPEHGLNPSKDFDLLICIPAYQWIGTTLPALFFRAVQLDAALAARRRLVDARGPIISGGTPFSFYGSGERQSRWTLLRTVFMDIVNSTNRDAGIAAKRLEILEARRLPTMERYTERWNRAQMEAEERRQRKASSAQANALRRELRRERSNMVREERLSHRNFRGHCGRRGRIGLGKPGEAQKIRNLVQRWTSWQVADAARKARLVAKQIRDRKARAKAMRDERWRWMNRKDLTMADLLHPSSTPT